ncbi:transglycosylase domain-containing protein [Streptomyces sp. NPDC021080]|uniref:transglycosylase domain-containing protein n=1 Tax=Streptomyces sp. NPDC021080 TaxID=3365110 RepID=UPI0037952913
MSDEPQQRSQGWASREPGAGPRPDPDPAAGPQPGPRPGPETGPGAGPGGPGTKQKPKAKQTAKPKRKPRPKRTGLRRLVPTWRMLLGTVLGTALFLAGLFALGYFLVKIPSANAAAVKQSNVFLYADGSQLARDGDVNRENVALEHIAKNAQHATLAAEDRDFYSESAIDPKAMIRAGWNTVTGKGRQSGSTITQQYVKNYYLGQEQTVTRKVKEFFISIKLDREKSKDEILEGYLNTSYYGRNAYGIQAAAQAYYGVNARDLTVGQGAYLAALLNAPSEYDVIAHPENRAGALARWNYVLDGMVKQKWLTRAARARVSFPKPRQAKGTAGLSGQRGYLVQAVTAYLTSNRILDEDTLTRGGYRITTTLQKPKQDAFVKAVNDQMMDQLDRKNRKADTYVRAGGVAIDPASGKVLAMYGGIDYTRQYVNNATRRDYQVGSTFKPFVFASAVQNGSLTQDGRAITPNTVYDGTDQRPVQGWNGSGSSSGYAPENEDGKSYGDISVRTATDRSVNSVYAQMAVDVGPANVERTAVALGLPADTPDLTASPSIALGPATASVLDMAEAYATLANHGRHGAYTLVEKITKDGSENVPLPAPDSAPTDRQAVSREAADTTTDMLQGVVDGGTGQAAQNAGRPAAGKTGTAEEDTAAWFAGYTPDLATVVAVMGQDPDTGAHKSLYGALGRARINGGGYPAQIWAQFTQDALEGTEVSDFDLQLQPGAEEPEEPADDTGTPDPTGSQDSGGGQNSGGANGGGTNGGQDVYGTQGGANGSRPAPTHGRTPDRGRSQGPDRGRSQGPAHGGTGGTGTSGGTSGTHTGGPHTDARTDTHTGGATTGGGTTGTAPRDSGAGSAAVRSPSP